MRRDGVESCAIEEESRDGVGEADRRCDRGQIGMGVVLRVEMRSVL